LWNALGVAPGGGTRYCGKQCRDAALGGGSSGGGSSGGIAGGLAGAIAGGIANSRAESKAYENEQKGKVAAEAAELQNLAGAQFSDSKDRIAEELNSLILQYKSKKVASNDMADTGMAIKKTKKLIVEKLEYGLTKLQRIAPEEAEYFAKRIDAIKKGRKTALFVKLGGFGLGTLLLVLSFPLASVGMGAIGVVLLTIMGFVALQI